MKEALKFLNKPLTIRWYLLNPGYTTLYLIKSETVSYIVSQDIKKKTNNFMKKENDNRWRIQTVGLASTRRFYLPWFYN